MRLNFFFYLLFHFSSMSAETDIESLNRLLTEWEPQSLSKVQQLEELSTQTRSKDVALRLAFILAFAPEENLKVKPHIYANFALQNRKDLQIDDLFSLYRIAGDGFYQNLDFKKAHAIFSNAVADKQIENKDREYFVYKNAWALLNLKKPVEAYATLKSWLTKNEISFLRAPMMVDLGRSWGESVFEKNKIISKDHLYIPQNDIEAQQITEGLLKALQRIPTKIDVFYKIFFANKWSPAALTTVLEHPLIQKKGTCEIMNMKKHMQDLDINITSILPRLNECAVKLLHSTNKKSRQAYFEVAHWMQSFTLDTLQQWTVARLWSEAQQPNKACHISLQMIPQMLNAKTAWSSDWSKDLIKFCQKGLSVSEFEEIILEQANAWKDLNLEETFIEANTISATTKKNLVQKWLNNKPPQSEKEKNLILLSLSDLPEKNQKTLEELCPANETRCVQLWNIQLTKSPQILKNIIDQEGSIQTPSSDIFIFISKLKEFLNDREYKLLFAPAIPNQLKSSSLNADIEVLNELLKYRQTASREINLNEKSAVDAISIFQEQASIARKHKWFFSSARNKAQYEVSQIALHIKNQITTLGMTKDEKKQWQMIGETLNKWILK